MVKSWSRDCSCDHGCYIHCVTRTEGNFGLCYQQHCRFPHKSAAPRPSTLRLCCHLSGEREHFTCPGSTCQKRLAYILGDTLCCKGSSAVRQRAWEKSWSVGSVGKVHIFFFVMPVLERQTSGSQELTGQPTSLKSNCCVQVSRVRPGLKNQDFW